MKSLYVREDQHKIVDPLFVSGERLISAASKSHQVIRNSQYPALIQLPGERFEPTAVSSKSMDEQSNRFAIGVTTP